MQRKISTWQFMLNSLEANIPVMLLYVLESKGSSPGRQGFFMAVNSNGEMSGSIGGGIMEHKFVEMAKAKLETDEASLHRQVHDKSAKEQSGMICSGEQTIFIFKLKKENADAIKNIIDTLSNNKNGQLQLKENIFSFVAGVNAETKYILKEDQSWSYEESVGYKDHLYIVGGGHCALALSKLMLSLDFYIHLFDERAELNTIHQNDFVHEKNIVKSYSELSSLIPHGENNYVVIMTFGYRTDEVALIALYGKQFKYIGCLGSKNKMEKMTRTFTEKGLETEWLERVHAPVGIQIKSQTPEEIAVSIAAEVIQVRNKGKN